MSVFACSWCTCSVFLHMFACSDVLKICKHSTYHVVESNVHFLKLQCFSTINQCSFSLKKCTQMIYSTLKTVVSRLHDQQAPPWVNRAIKRATRQSNSSYSNPRLIAVMLDCLMKNRAKQEIGCESACMTHTHMKIVPQSWHVSNSSIARLATSCHHAALPSIVSHVAFHTCFAVWFVSS